MLRKVGIKMIEKAQKKDIREILAIIDESKLEMDENNNPQWSEENYPECKIPNDIEKGNLFVYKEKDKIKGFIVIEKDTREYDDLIENSKKEAFILHRLAIKKSCQNQGFASSLFQFAEQKAKKEKIKVLKADTEKRNFKMNHFFKKLNYIEKGTFNYDDYPGTYIYYEKEIGEEK